MSAPAPTSVAYGGICIVLSITYIPGSRCSITLLCSLPLIASFKYNWSIAACNFVVATWLTTPVSPNDLTLILSSSLACKLLRTGLSTVPPVSRKASACLYVYVSASAKILSYCVSNLVLPTAGEPSATLPLPIYNSCVSTAHPNSPDASCGNPLPKFFCPRLICIRDI